MEFKEVIGRRRSTRYYDASKPVEKEKIQIILEAARVAPCAANTNLLRAIVVEREKAPKELLDSVPEFNQVHINQSPVLIFWYVDMSAWEDRADRVKELIDIGALNSIHGWSHEYVDKSYIPKLSVSKPSEVISYIEGGLGIAQGILAAIDEGLGVCLNLCDDEVAKKALGLPDTAKVLWLMTVGYPVEDPQGVSQSPRRGFEELFFIGKYGNPFPRDEGVVEKLEKAKMI